MTTLRQNFIRELVIRGTSPRTQESYTAAVYGLAKHYHQPPDQISDDQIKDYMFYLASERKLAASTLNLTVCALRSFYQLVLQRPLEPLKLTLPWVAKAVRRPQVFATEELERLFTVGCPNPKHRAFLMTVYGGGLRLMEACHLQPAHIDSARMQIRVVEGKGRNYAKVVVMQRCGPCDRAERIFALNLAEDWDRRKAGEVYERRASCGFRPDSTAVQEPLGSSAHCRQLPWHNAKRLRVGFARARIHPWRDTCSRPGS
jgi:hypothetical protein